MLFGGLNLVFDQVVQAVAFNADADANFTSDVQNEIFQVTEQLKDLFQFTSLEEFNGVLQNVIEEIQRILIESPDPAIVQTKLQAISRSFSQLIDRLKEKRKQAKNS